MEYFDPKSTYIWALAVARDGSLFVGTGGEGKIFRVTSAWQWRGVLRHRPSQRNRPGVRQRRPLAGRIRAEWLLYRISAKNKAFVLYDSSLPEIRAMAVDAAGSVYAAGLGGAVAKKAQSATQPGGAGAVTGMPTFTTSITVTGEAAQTGGEIKPAPEPSKPQPAPAAIQPAPATTATTVDLTRCREIRDLQNSPGQYRRDAIQFQGRERLRHSGALWRATILYRCERPYVPLRRGSQAYPGRANQ